MPAAAREVLNLLGSWRVHPLGVIHRALASPAKEHRIATRLPASQRSREELTSLRTAVMCRWDKLPPLDAGYAATSLRSARASLIKRR